MGAIAGIRFVRRSRTVGCLGGCTNRFAWILLESFANEGWNLRFHVTTRKVMVGRTDRVGLCAAGFCLVGSIDSSSSV